MNEQLFKLQKLGYDLNDFYAITIYVDKITLQGHLDKSKKDKYKALGYDFICDDYLQSFKDGIDITLTY